MKWFFTLVLTLAGSANSHSHSRHLDEAGGCGAPQLTEEEKASVEAQLAARPSQQFRNSSSAMMEISLPITIPVYFHVLQKDATVGSLDDATVQDIVNFLQQEYDESAGPYKFELKSTTRTINPDWYDGCGPDSVGGNEAEFKVTLKQGGKDALNLYSCDTTSQNFGLMGWAYFPVALQSSTPYLDGVVIVHPDVVSLQQTKVTLVHEMGHWSGLYHTFEGYSASTGTGGCNIDNDKVSDTPAHQTPTRDVSTGSDVCWKVDPPLDTCTGDGFAGVDPVTNYMNYLPANCREEFGTFTPGQVARMVMMFETYRFDDNGSPTTPGTPTTPSPVTPGVSATPTKTPTKAPTKSPAASPTNPAPVTPGVSATPTKAPTKAPATSPTNTAPVNSTPTLGLTPTITNPTNTGPSPTSSGGDISAFRCFNTYVRSRCSCGLFTRGSTCPLDTIARYCRSGQSYQQRVLVMYRRFCRT